MLLPLLFLFLLRTCAIVHAALASSPGTTQQTVESPNTTSTTSMTIITMPRHTYAPSAMEAIHSKRVLQLSKPKPSKSLHAATAKFIPNTLAKHADVTSDQVKRANALVNAAHESQAAYNLYRANNTRRNTNLSKKSAVARAAKEKRDKGAVVEPMHSKEVMEAVRLLGDIDALAKSQNGTLIKDYPPHNNTTDRFTRPNQKFSAGDKLETRVNNNRFWMANMNHLGIQPYGGDTSYEVRLLR